MNKRAREEGDGGALKVSPRVSAAARSAGLIHFGGGASWG
jgi:hypothetical protein